MCACFSYVSVNFQQFPSLIDYDHDALLAAIVGTFTMRYDVGCEAALHHNKKKTNLHVHLIFSERESLEIPEEKVVTRNRFYDETGKHVRTKKEILDEEGIKIDNYLRKEWNHMVDRSLIVGLKEESIKGACKVRKIRLCKIYKDLLALIS